MVKHPNENYLVAYSVDIRRVLMYNISSNTWLTESTGEGQYRSGEPSCTINMYNGTAYFYVIGGNTHSAERYNVDAQLVMQALKMSKDGIFH